MGLGSHRGTGSAGRCGAGITAFAVLRPPTLTSHRLDRDRVTDRLLTREVVVFGLCAACRDRSHHYNNQDSEDTTTRRTCQGKYIIGSEEGGTKEREGRESDAGGGGQAVLTASMSSAVLLVSLLSLVVLSLGTWGSVQHGEYTHTRTHTHTHTRARIHTHMHAHAHKHKRTFSPSPLRPLPLPCHPHTSDPVAARRRIASVRGDSLIMERHVCACVRLWCACIV